MVVITVSQARAKLHQLLDRVRPGEEITITRHGVPVAVLLRPDSLRTRRVGAAAQAASRIRDALEAARSMPLANAGGLSATRADELVAEISAARAAR
jgi:antitoxin (DNA-binding transcriptional repressor) of toxin-antitoxin stability system